MGVEVTGPSGLLAQIETPRALRTAQVARGPAFAASGVSGSTTAALAANSALFAMRLDPGASVLAFVERIRVQVTCLTAFTAPLTAGRRLALFRGSGAAASGGNAVVPVMKDVTGPASEFTIAQGGDMRISSGGALTVTGITFEADPFRTMMLAHVGAAGAYAEALWELNPSEAAPIVMQPGHVLAIRNPVAFDAAGQFQIAVNVDWIETAAL